MDNYDEDLVFGNYVVHNFLHLMTPFERRIYLLAIKREKAADGGPVATFLPKYLAAETPDVVAASSAGFDTIKQQIAKRILADCSTGH